MEDSEGGSDGWFRGCNMCDRLSIEVRIRMLAFKVVYLWQGSVSWVAYKAAWVW